MPHRFYRLAELQAQMSFNIMVCWAIFSQTLKLGYAYMTNWCGARVVLHANTLTGSVWATVSVCLWVSSGDAAASYWAQVYVVCVSASSGLVPIQSLQLYFRQELVGHLDRLVHCACVYVLSVCECVCLFEWVLGCVCDSSLSISKWFHKASVQ